MADKSMEAETKQITVSPAVGVACENIYQFTLHLCDVVKLCFDRAVLEHLLSEVEKARTAHYDLLDELRNDDYRLLHSCFLLCRSVEKYLLGLIFLKSDA